jgi:hypothetical protein
VGDKAIRGNNLLDVSVVGRKGRKCQTLSALTCTGNATCQCRFGLPVNAQRGKWLVRDKILWDGAKAVGSFTVNWLLPDGPVSADAACVSRVGTGLPSEGQTTWRCCGMKPTGPLWLLPVLLSLGSLSVWAQAPPPVLSGSATLKPGDAPLRRPVVFSYNHPWGSDQNPNKAWTDPWLMDFGQVRLSTANMVDNVDPKAYAVWRTPDRRILARVSHWATPWTDDKANDLIKAWDEALKGEGIDGFAMDEFIGNEITPELVTVYVTALKEIRRRHPDKVLAFWTESGFGRVSLFGQIHKPLLEALRDNADFVMPEIYYSEKAVPDFKTDPDPFPVFREKVQEWEAQAPGLTPKLLMGLGTVQTADWGYDNLPNVDYAEFLARQVEVCATDPVLKQMGGLALYAPGYLHPETLGKLNAAIIKHYGLER